MRRPADELVTRDIFAGLAWPASDHPEPDPFTADEMRRILGGFRQFQRLLALEAAGLDLPTPDERTATIAGRTYQLPEVTASVVRGLCTPMTIPSSANVDESLLVAEPKEDVSMPTVEPRDPNTQLNGPEPPQAEESGFIASVKRYCTIRHGVIAGAVVVLGTAVYLAVTRGTEVPPTA